VAAVDYFLKIDTIDGESQDIKHKGEIELDSFSFGVNQTGSVSFGGGAGAGKAQFQDFHFTSSTGKSSPKLMQSCATGVHFKKAVLTMRKAGETPKEFIKITLEDLLVSSYQNGGSRGSETLPADQFSLNYAKITFVFTPEDDKGASLPPITGGFDVKLNRAV